MPFTTTLVVQIHTNHPQEREIYLPFSYTCASGYVIDVPVDFFTNFASVPRFLWWLLPPLDHYGKATVIHDYLYRVPMHGINKDFADLTLREACKELKVKRWKYELLYYSVKFFGFHAWNKHRR